MASMQHKVVVITGAASGIGLETAKLLAGRGAVLSLADVRREPLEAAAREISRGGTKVMTTVLDISKKEQVEAWIQDTVKAFGKIDGAANMAGVIGSSMGKKTIVDFDDDAEWDMIISVNITGAWGALTSIREHTADTTSSQVQLPPRADESHAVRLIDCECIQCRWVARARHGSTLCCQQSEFPRTYESKVDTDLQSTQSSASRVVLPRRVASTTSESTQSHRKY